LNRDAGIRALEHRGNAAERQAFEERVDGCGERRPFALKIVTSATIKPPKTPPSSMERPLPEPESATSPGPCGGGHDAEQEESRLVDGALQRHRVAEATWPLKAFSLNAGLEVRIRFAIDVSMLDCKY